MKVNTLLLALLMSTLAFGQYAHAKNRENKSHKEKDEAKHTQDFQRSFDLLLTFEQELSGAGVPLPPSVKPDNIFGRLQLCFNKELSEIKYKLYVFNDINPSNKNALIIRAHLHAAKAGQNGSIFAFLLHDEPGPCGIESNGLLAEGTITNSDITPVTSTDGTVFINNVASILDGIRRGEVYANVHGSNTCDPTQQGFASGMIRGQIFTHD